MAELLLVHGAWHGSWCWEPLVPELTRRGHTVHTVDLPTSGSASSVADDAEVVRRAVEAIGGPVAVIGHSYGGIPVTEATAGLDSVSHLVYLAAFMFDVGECVTEVLGDNGPDTDLMPPLPGSGDLLYADVEPELADRALARLVSQSTRAFRDRQTAAGWHTIPSAYIVCDQDQIVPPALQEQMAGHAKTVQHLPTSHSPFMSAPADLAALLDEVV